MLTGRVLKGPTAYHDKVLDVLRSTTCCYSSFFAVKTKLLHSSNKLSYQTNSGRQPSQHSQAGAVSFLVSYLLSFFGLLFNPPLSHLVTHFRQSVLVQIHTISEVFKMLKYLKYLRCLKFSLHHFKSEIGTKVFFISNYK